MGDIAAADAGSLVKKIEKVENNELNYSVMSYEDFYYRLMIDLTGIEVGIDGHLLARHGIQGKARRYLGNTPCALGNHHEVDHRENGKHDDAHRIVAADQEVGEGLDHLAGRIGTSVE